MRMTLKNIKHLLNLKVARKLRTFESTDNPGSFTRRFKVRSMPSDLAKARLLPAQNPRRRRNGAVKPRPALK